MRATADQRQICASACRPQKKRFNFMSATLIPILALRQKKFDLKAAAGKMLARIAAEGRELNSTELAAHERNVAALAENEALLILAEEQLANERKMPATAHIAGDGNGKW